MQGPQWWLIALPTVSIVFAAIAGVYANIKLLLEIRKLTLETERLRAELADRDRRIHRPSEEEMRRFMEASTEYVRSMSENSRNFFLVAQAETGETARLAQSLEQLNDTIRGAIDVTAPVAQTAEAVRDAADRLHHALREALQSQHLEGVLRRLRLKLVLDERE